MKKERIFFRTSLLETISVLSDLSTLTDLRAMSDVIQTKRREKGQCEYGFKWYRCIGLDRETLGLDPKAREA